MNLQEVVLARPSPERGHSLDKRHTFNVADRSSQLDNAHIRNLVGVIHGDLSDTLYPVLDRIGDVRDDLNGFTQIVALTLTLDDMIVYLARRDVVLPSEGDV